jgi:hypothetical protein
MVLAARECTRRAMAREHSRLRWTEPIRVCDAICYCQKCHTRKNAPPAQMGQSGSLEREMIKRA